MNGKSKTQNMESLIRYKDSLFVFLFGSEKRKKYTLSLYNALNGTNYTDPIDEVEKILHGSHSRILNDRT